MDPYYNLVLLGAAAFLLLALAVLGIGGFLLVTWLCGDDDY